MRPTFPCLGNLCARGNFPLACAINLSRKALWSNSQLCDLLFLQQSRCIGWKQSCLTICPCFMWLTNHAKVAVHLRNSFNYPKKNLFEMLLMVWVVFPPHDVSLSSPDWKFRAKETSCFILARAPVTLALSAGRSWVFFFTDSSPATDVGCWHEMTWTPRKIRNFSVIGLLLSCQ